MLKDILYKACYYLGLDEVEDYITNAISNSNEVAEPEDLTMLINLSNLVLRNITREYMPLVKQEAISSNDNCEILYSNFSRTANKVNNVCFVDGLNSTYRIFPEYIKVGKPNSIFIVNYNYAPAEMATIFSEVEKPLGLSDDTIALGVVSEYLAINSLYDEADMYEEKFKVSLDNSMQTSRERKVFNRGWI